jgi:hypothetical protein
MVDWNSLMSDNNDFWGIDMNTVLVFHFNDRIETVVCDTEEIESAEIKDNIISNDIIEISEEELYNSFMDVVTSASVAIPCEIDKIVYIMVKED